MFKSIVSHFLFGTLLLVFYFSGSFFTKYKAHIKQQYDNDIIEIHDPPRSKDYQTKSISTAATTTATVSSSDKGGGNRGIVQVFSTAGVGVLVAFLHLYWYYTDITYQTFIQSLPFLCIPLPQQNNNTSSIFNNIHSPSSRFSILLLAYLG